MKNIYIIGIVCFTSLLSCKTNYVDIITPIIPLYNSIGAVEDTTILNNIDVFSFESNKHSLLGDVDRVLKFQNVYYVLDKRMKQVLAFDNHGKHLFTIHTVGNGVGEYAHLRDITIDKEKKQLLLLTIPSSIMYYSLDGTYERSLPLKRYYDAIASDDKNIYLNCSPYVNNKLSSSSLSIIQKSTGKMVDVLEPLPEIAPYCHSQGTQMSATEKPYYTRKFDNYIYQLANGRIDTLYHLEWDKYSFPESLKDKTFDCVELNKICQEYKYIYSVTDLQESNKQLIFRTNVWGIYVLSKHDESLIKYDMIMNTDFNFPLPNYLPIGGEGNEVFFMYPVAMLQNLKKYLEKKGDIQALEKITKLLGSVDEEANPFIFRYTLK